MTPIHPVARTLAYLEAVIGQLYIAVLIASLVGRYTAGPGSLRVASLPEGGTGIPVHEAASGSEGGFKASVRSGRTP